MPPLLIHCDRFIQKSFWLVYECSEHSNMHMVNILLEVLICILKAAGVKRHKDDTVGSV